MLGESIAAGDSYRAVCKRIFGSLVRERIRGIYGAFRVAVAATDFFSFAIAIVSCLIFRMARWS